MESLDKVQRVQTWKDALNQAANLSGFDSRVIKPESVLVNNIVDDVLKKLDKIRPIDLEDYDSEDHDWPVHPYDNVLIPASIIYPESMNPDWFHYQSRGSFVDVKLPPLCLNCNFLCFALCVVVTIPNIDRQCNHPDSEFHRLSKVTYDCIVKSKDGNRHVEINLFGHHRFRGKPCLLLEMPDCGPDSMKSNHVIIGFGYYFFREFCDNEFSFQFNVEKDSFSFHSKDDKEHFKVEMCGVHLMSDLHLETSDESEEEDESYLEESDEEVDILKDLKNLMRKMNRTPRD
ncbi:hypothetical protein LWI28_000046 [Acer negundo]|uniref:Uncharacterized protein n=1 Tax=Acer negundo TaxID=4023 RepID=A0AAD5IC43_ACENE|nr:hypothetical protein LWI28_000046 [Acer negundo]